MRAAGVSLGALCACASFAADELVIDNFDHGLSHGVYTKRGNTVGGYQGTWAKRPSYALLRKSNVHRRGDRGLGMILEWKKEGGWCGWYTLLQDANGVPVDATPYNALCFWIKGEKGGENFDIGFADAEMQELEIDAVYAGAVGAFLPGGVTKEWREVKVPLSRIESWINMRSLGSLVFWVRDGGAGTVYVDDIVLRDDPDIAAFEEHNAARAEKDPGHPRALWVWKIDPVNNRLAREDLYALCERCNIEIMYLFFGDFDPVKDTNYVAELEQFMKGCHERGVKVEGLTGNPVWTLREFHPKALAWITQFLEYNKTRPPELRFGGVSLDVEPYLTAEWNQQKASVKEQYLELLAKCRALVDGYGQDHFLIGAATPMAYEQEEKADGFLTSVLKQLDYIALMAYYDTPRKVIENSVFHVELARKLGKKCWIGAELQDLVQMKQGNRGNTFWEEGWVEMEDILGSVANRFRGDPGYGGLAIHCYYAYKILQRERNVPRKERPAPEASAEFTLAGRMTKVPLTVDGKLDDWTLGEPLVLSSKDDVAHGRGAWTGPDDFSVRTHAMWDVEKLYFAFDVTDDRVVQRKTGADMWEGDHIEFWLDVDLAGDYEEAANSGDDFQFGFSPGNFDDVAPEVFLWTPYVDEDVREVVDIGASRTDTGWVVEVGIPIEFLTRGLKKRIGVEPRPDHAEANRPLAPALPGARDELRIGRGARLGLCVDPSDCDNPEIPQKLLMSTAGEKRVWGDPTTFGFLRLAGEDGRE